MTKPIAIVSVRSSSSRLPNKCFLQLGRYSVLEHVIRRADDAGFQVIVATSTDSSDDKIGRLCRDIGTQLFRGSLKDKISRWKDTFSSYDIPSAHLIDADDPYFNPAECLNSLETLNSQDLDIVFPSLKSNGGSASVGTSISRNYLNEVFERTRNLGQDFDVIPWESIIQAEDRTLTLADDDTFTFESAPRLTLDYEEDYKLMNEIAEKFDYNAERHAIEEFLFGNKGLLSINASRTQDFKNNQASFVQANFGIERK